MKTLGKILCKAAVFVVLLAVCLHFLTNTFRVKDESYMASGFYGYRDGAFDVVSVGTSLLQYGVHPMQLWEEYGIPSYCLGAGNESLPTSYYLVKEAIERQHPKLILLDVGSIYKDGLIRSNEWLHHVTDAMPLWSMNRLRIITELADHEREPLVLPFEAYHMRWTDLTETDFEEEYQNATHGAVLLNGTHHYELFERHELETEDAMADEAFAYLEKTIQLCRDTDTQLLLLSMPVFGDGWMLEQWEFDLRRNAAYALEDYCEQNGVDYLNLIDSNDMLGLSSTEDAFDSEHLNMKGAAKFTAYMGNYMQEQYALPDRRGDADYAFMDRDDGEYREVYQKERLHSSNLAGDYIEALLDEEYSERYLILFAAAAGDDAQPVSEDAAEVIHDLGLTQDLSALGGQAYCAVIDSGWNVYETALSEGMMTDSYELTTEDLSAAVYSDAANSGASRFVINGREYTADAAGLNLLVYDKRTNEVIDAAAASERGIK